MKKMFLSVILVMFLLGCVNKPYEAKESELINELKEMEEQLVENESEQVVNIEETSSEVQKIEVDETQLVNLKVNAEDDDKDSLSYSFTAPLDDTGKWQTNYGDAGEYAVTITASDGSNNVEQKVLIVVKKKNVPPVIENVPLTLDAKEGDAVKLEPKVTDPNRDDFTVSYSAPLDENGEWETDHKSSGEYDITVTATDGELEATAKLTLKVENVNVPPELSNVESLMVVNEGETVTIKPEVSDEDGDSVELSISEPVGDDGEWATSYTDHGEYIVTVAASDGKDTVSKEVKLTVNDVNVPPRIVSITQG